MPSSKMRNYVERLILFGQPQIALSTNRFNIFAALVKNGKVVDMSQNYHHFHHAETSILKRNSHILHKKGAAPLV